jgi:ubiquinone/menaquinone biosynthesis C-methylase UbiE
MVQQDQLQQDRIWEYFQNEGIESFQQSGTRLRFLADRIPPGKNVLNVGVGNGEFESIAIQKKLDVYSLDPSETSIRRIQQRFHLGDKAVVGYGQSMPFRDGQFDFVVISEVLEHLTDEVVVATLGEIHRVLKPGGRILGTVPSREQLESQEVVCPCCESRFHRWGHLQQFTPERLRDLLSSFVVERMGERMFESTPHLNWKGRTAAFLRRVLSQIGVRNAGDRIWFAARKVR